MSSSGSISIKEMARNLMRTRQWNIVGRRIYPALRHDVRTTRVEAAACRGVQQIGNRAGDALQLAASAFTRRNCVQQTDGVRVLGRLENLMDCSGLDHAPSIHD